MMLRVARPVAYAAVVACAFSGTTRAAAQQREPSDSAVPVRPIVLRVTGAPRTMGETPYTVSVLSADEIVRAGPGLSLSAALALVPGVTSLNRYNAARDESISIRGFGARAAFGIRGVRVLLDGIPQTLPDGQGQLTNIDLRSVSRIEVLRGAASALYGNAAGGVISVWTDPGAVTGVLPEARVFAGSHRLLTVDAGLTTPVGAGRLTARGSRTRSDGFRLQSRSEVWRGSVHGSFPVGERTRITAAVHLADLPVAEDPGALTSEELAADRTQAAPRNLAVGARKDVFQGQGGVTVERFLSGGGRVQLTGFGLRRDLVNTLSFATIDLERWAYGARGLATFPIPRALGAEVTVGADVQWQRDDRRHVSPDGTTITRDQLERVREVGPFVQLSARPHRRLALSAGARYDAVRFRVSDRLLADGDDSGERLMTALSGTVGATLRLTQALLAYASVGTAFQAPTTTELANQLDGSDGFNRDLEPQRATQYELGVRGRSAIGDFSVAVFQADVRDALIPFEVPTVPDRRFFRNAGKSRHRGIEIGVSVVPVPGVRMNAAYTYFDLRFVDFTTEGGVFDDNRVPGVPTRFLTSGLRVHRGRVRLDVETRVTASLYVDDANTTRNDGWWVTDVRLGADVRLGGSVLSPYAGIENLFDREYVEAVAVNARFERYFEPAPGRMIYLGMSVGR
ncbi:MAG: TonB-dependent receptor [Gemmatimonadetes bacterium]|nr:TonB-dependent receptor [Gemmatimonadota bacterium]